MDTIGYRNEGAAGDFFFVNRNSGEGKGTSVGGYFISQCYQMMNDPIGFEKKLIFQRHNREFNIFIKFVRQI
jgi:hypothetical protein